jgi:simple sugar transport system permease protein
LFSVPAVCIVALGGAVWLSRRLLARRSGGRLLSWIAGLLAATLALLVARSSLVDGFGIAGVLLATMSVGLVLGALSGFLVARGGLQPFIVTLAAMVAVLGVARLVAGQDQSVYPIYTGTNAPESFGRLRESVFGVPIPGLVFLLVVLVFTILLQRTAFGRHVYALGGNEAAARLSGIRVARVKVVVFALSGMLSCMAGVFYAAQYRQGKPDAGTGLELDAIAAVVIGGTNLMGGRGSVTGTLGGVVIFGLLSNLLQLNNIDGNTQLVLKGVIIVVAVLLQEADLRSFWPRGRESGGLES